MSKAFPWYTARGDDGTTGLLGAGRVPKHHPQPEAFGAVDEAGSMIGFARALGIPARYVSGLVHPENTEYRGFTQTHAWCELYFPTYGWIAFDPTNCCVVGPNFIQVAVGRDFRDVAPSKDERIVIVSQVLTNDLANAPSCSRY